MFTMPADPAGGLDAGCCQQYTGQRAFGEWRGNDTLDGGIGADTLTGGLGDDTYVIDDAGDVVDEVADEGTDTIVASINIDLSLAMFSTSMSTSHWTGDNLGVTGNDLGNEITETAATISCLAERRDFLSGGGGHGSDLPAARVTTPI